MYIHTTIRSHTIVRNKTNKQLLGCLLGRKGKKKGAHFQIILSLSLVTNDATLYLFTFTLYISITCYTTTHSISIIYRHIRVECLHFSTLDYLFSKFEYIDESK
jgi:hypothetical protein